MWAWSHLLSILLLSSTGSSPIAISSSRTVVNLGETRPPSIRLTAACVVPARSAS